VKRVVAISDFHCGHRVGLTPPDYADRSTAKWNRAQRDLWTQYARMVKQYSPVDILLVLGDVIDGRGERSGSTELITTDRLEQGKMAADCINMWKADNIVMVFGTAYHTGQKEDFETSVAEMVHANKIGGQEWVKVDNVIFDLKHHIGTSSIPHGKGTPLAKEWLWNLVWNLRREQPMVDIFLRGHTHSFDYVGNDSYLAVAMPALQGLGSKFGARIPNKRVDFGVIYFDVEGKKYTWGWDIVAVESQKPKVIKL